MSGSVRTYLLGAFCCFGFTTFSTAQTQSARDTVSPPIRFLTVEKFLELRGAEQEMAVTGFIDGMSFAYAIYAPKADLTAWERCLVGKSSTQLNATIENRLRAQPERWHLAFSVEAWNALNKFCHSTP